MTNGINDGTIEKAIQEKEEKEDCQKTSICDSLKTSISTSNSNSYKKEKETPKHNIWRSPTTPPTTSRTPSKQPTNRRANPTTPSLRATYVAKLLVVTICG